MRDEKGVQHIPSSNCKYPFGSNIPHENHGRIRYHMSSLEIFAAMRYAMV